MTTTTTSNTSQTQSSTSFDDGHHVYINSSVSVSVSGRAARTPTWRRLHLVDSELSQHAGTVEQRQTSPDNYQHLDLSVLETPRQPLEHEYANISPNRPDVSQGVYNTGPGGINPATYERLDPARSSRHEYASISGTLQITGSEAHDYLEPITYITR